MVNAGITEMRDGEQEESLLPLSHFLLSVVSHYGQAIAEAMTGNICLQSRKAYRKLE